MDKKAPEKKQRLLAALDQGMVMIHLDARRPGVLVPQDIRQEAHLRLNLSYRFDPPDLAVGEWGVRCSLSFKGSRFTVAVPWNALFAITSYATKEFWLYPDDMPPELIEQSLTRARDEVEAEKKGAPAALPALASLDGAAERPEPPKKPRAILREVVTSPSPSPSATSASDSKEEPPKDDPPKPPSRGHLRLVK